MGLYIPPLPKEEHPIATKHYLIATPAINTAYDRIYLMIMLRRPGGALFANTRVGKTSAIKYMKASIQEDFPGVVVHSFSCKKSKSPSESAFHENLLHSVGHSDSTSGAGWKKKRRLATFLCEQVLASPSKHLVLFVDEAQRMSLIEWEWLRDLHDALDDVGCKMTTISVGQPELIALKNALRHGKQMHIVSRFLVDEIEFSGIGGEVDLKSCLERYDDSVFPPSSDWNFTRFFLPRAHEDGLRLADCVSDAWSLFSEAYLLSGSRDKTEIPMAYFTAAVESILLRYSSSDSPGFRVSRAIWKQAINDSGYAQAMADCSLILADDATT